MPKDGDDSVCRSDFVADNCQSVVTGGRKNIPVQIPLRQLIDLVCRKNQQDNHYESDPAAEPSQALFTPPDASLHLVNFDPAFYIQVVAQIIIVLIFHIMFSIFR